MRGRKGHIFNLGHGVPPNAKLENIGRLGRNSACFQMNGMTGRFVAVDVSPRILFFRRIGAD